MGKLAINTSERLFDLVRYMRAELHEAELVTDEEYAWLCSSEMATSPTGGSPSPRRLEEYDAERKRLDWAIKHPYQFKEIYNWFGNENPALFREKIDQELAKEQQTGAKGDNFAGGALS